MIVPSTSWLQMNYHVTKVQEHGSHWFNFSKQYKREKKSLGPYRICLQNSRTKPTNLHLQGESLGPNRIFQPIEGAELAALFSRQILNGGTQDLFLSFIFKYLLIFFRYESIEIYALHFCLIIIHL